MPWLPPHHHERRTSSPSVPGFPVWRRVDLDEVALPLPMPDDELLALDEALDRLATVDARAAEVVKLCFFVGLTQDQVAKEMGISLAAAERLWSFARAWLFRKVHKSRGDP